MLENTPTKQEIINLIGIKQYDLWIKLCKAIEEKYDMERIWNSGGKAWNYEYKYRRGGKTLCALYAKENLMGFLAIFGKQEREKFKQIKASFSKEIIEKYDEAQTYHDGKWVMFLPDDESLINEYVQLLLVKRRPNVK